MTNVMTQSYFPNFVPNQILTNVQLNELRQFLDGQNRITRTHLIGTGIVCGLHPVLIKSADETYTIRITEGFGVTSDGFIVEIPETGLVHIRNYHDPYQERIDKKLLSNPTKEIYWPAYAPWRLNITDINPNERPKPITQIPIKELLTDQEIKDPLFKQETDNVSAPIKEEDLKDKVLVLYLEMAPQDLKSCLSTDCNNKGQNLYLTVRVLLIDKKYLSEIQPCSAYTDAIEIPRLITALRKSANIELTEVDTIDQINTAYREIAQHLKDGLIQKIQLANAQWGDFLGLQALKPQIDDLQARLDTIYNAPTFNQYHFDFFKDLVQAYNEFSLNLCALIKDCCFEGNFPRHLMLDLFLPEKTVKLALSECPNFSSPSLQENAKLCIDFDGGDGLLMQKDLNAKGKSVKLSNDILVYADSFTSPNGRLFFNEGLLDNRHGQGASWRFNNMCLDFDFSTLPFLVQKVSFSFYYAGGSDNFSVNDAPRYIGKILDIPIKWPSNLTVQVRTSPIIGSSNQQGTVTITGPINSILIGGQELWIDNLCVEEATPIILPWYRNHFTASPVRNVWHKDFEHTRKLFCRIIQLSQHFQTLNAPNLKITPSQTEQYPLGTRAIPFYYREGVHTHWLPSVCCTPEALSYRENKMTTAVAPNYNNRLQNPAHFSLLPHTFYRIEGHLGKPGLDIAAKIGKMRQEHNLEFALHILHLGNQIDQTPDNLTIDSIWNRFSGIYSQINREAENDNFNRNRYNTLLSERDKLLEQFIIENKTWVAKRQYGWLVCDPTSWQNNYMQLRTELLSLIHQMRPVPQKLPSVLTGQTTFEVRFEQINALSNLLKIILTNDVLSFNYAFFALVLKRLIGVIIELKLLLFSFYQNPPNNFDKNKYYPTWHDFEHLLNHTHYNSFLPRFANTYFILEYLLQGKTRIFKQFALKHPGLEHQAGVVKGGTFILLCKTTDEQIAEVVADFTLEQFLDQCCCDNLLVQDVCLPPIALPDYRIAIVADSIEVDVKSNDFLQHQEHNLGVVLPNPVSDKGGSLRLNPNSLSITYNPPENRGGVDHFTYLLIDRDCGDILADMGHVYILLPKTDRVICPYPSTKSGAQFKAIDPWQEQAIFTVGETIDGYTPPGHIHGITASLKDQDTIRFYINHSIPIGMGYRYPFRDNLNNAYTGARISFLDFNFKTNCFQGAGLAYHQVRERKGLTFRGFDRLTPAKLYQKGEFGFKDTIYLTGEASVGSDSPFPLPDGGTAYALDVEKETMFAVPFLGRAQWKSISAVDLGQDGTIALLISDSRPNASLLLYVGKPVPDTDNFLARNGLINGKLYTWVSSDGATSPKRFSGKGNTLRGKFVPIEHYNPDKAGQDGYDREGFVEQNLQDQLIQKSKAFSFSKPAGLSTNPRDPKQVVFASSGAVNRLFPDQGGTIYLISLQSGLGIDSIPADLTILYDYSNNNDFEAIYNPDSIVWTSRGTIYVQENHAESDDTFRPTTLPSIFELRPDPSSPPIRIGKIDRKAVPKGQEDQKADQPGAWIPAGIVEVSRAFDVTGDGIFLACSIMANSLAGGVIDNAKLVGGGQLILLKGKEPS